MHPCSVFLKSGASPLWKRLLSVRESAEKHMIWKLGSGKVNIWWDNWTSLGPLACLINPKVFLKLVQQYPGQWNSKFLSELGLDRFWKLIEPIFIAGGPGHLILLANFHYLRPSASQVTSQRIWHPFIPLKVSFLLWSLIARRAPVDECLGAIHISLASKCSCCSSATETIDHLFSGRSSGVGSLCVLRWHLCKWKRIT